MSYYFIINPKSANGKTEKTWIKEIAPVLKERGVDHEFAFTEGPLHATTLARKAAGIYNNIIAVGGDGTLHEVVNGLLDEDGKLANEDTNVGIICSGTGSDFIKTAGISRHPLEALETVLAGNVKEIDVLKGTYTSLDGGSTVQKFSINVADAGLGGEVVRAVNSRSKFLGGKVTFMLTELQCLLKFKKKPARVTIDDEEPREIDLIAIFFGNGRYNGGGLRAATRAELDDGLMDMFWVEGIDSKLTLITNLAKLYGDDDDAQALMKKFEGKTRYLKCKKAMVEPLDESREILIDFDGELVGKAPLSIEVIPGAVRLLAPGEFPHW